MFCWNCGKELADNARFCSACGKPAPQPRVAESPSQPAQTPGYAAQTQEASGTSTAQSQSAPGFAPQPQGTSGSPQTQGAPGAPAAAALPFTMKTAIIACSLALIVLLIALIAVILPGLTKSDPLGMLTGGAESANTQTTGTPSVTYAGKEVKAIPRPTLLAALDTANSQAVASELAPAVPDYEVDKDLGNVSNLDQFYFFDEETPLLQQNGFVVRAGTGNGSAEFHEVYESNRYNKNPSFVTVDSMMHAYHLYFSYLMKNTERNYLSDALLKASKNMLAASEAQLDQLSGTEWESAAKRNTAFFGVGVALLDETAQIPSSVSQTVRNEVSSIRSASGVSPSQLTGQYEDYSQYIVRGYYEGDPQLEAYFRAMMWYGRVNFTQKDEDLDRSALLMTLALHDNALDEWSSIYAVTSFFAGASDDCGYYEYYPIFQAAYGDDANVGSLAGNDGAWRDYHALTAQMPAPQINSVVVMDEGQDADHLAEEKGYRFMGQRFSFDATILQNLMYNKVGENPSGKARMLPNALDVPAALGSDEALSILDENGETSYQGYSENMASLRQKFADAPEDTWKASLYSQWLYTLDPLLDVKGEGWPSFMRTSAWARKNLQSYLGSYTELKHDTVLYSKQAMAELGGGMIEDKDDRGYVEAEPELFARLVALVEATSSGLEGFGMLGSEDKENLEKLDYLASQLQVIATKELQEESLTDDEFELIRSFGGQIEHFWQEVYKNEPHGEKLTTREFPAAIVTDVATDPNGSVLELGTGRVSTMFVIVPVDGKLRIASGPVYTFYQFEWPLSDRLTDTSWRQMMGIALQDDGTYAKPSQSVEDWTSTFQYEWRRQ